MKPLSFIPRHHYLKKTIPFVNKPLIKVFTGQRRSGKSYLMLQVSSYIATHFPEKELIFINKELPEFNDIKDDISLLAYIKERKLEGRKTCLFIDEVQEIASFEKALRGLLAENDYDIYCTGSNATLLSGELATMLSGRYIEIRVHTLSYSEFLQFHKLENTTATLIKYMVQGGMPFMIHLEDNDQIRQEYLRNVLNTILYKDVVQRFGVRNFTFLNNLMTYIADNIGSLLSSTRINEYLKSQRQQVSTTTILDYLHFTESSFLIHRVKRYDIAGKRIFEVNDKYYFEDLGLLHTLRQYDPKNINKYIENLVFKHLIFNNYQVFIGKLGDREIDFIGRKDDILIYIQVALSVAEPKTFEREFGNLLMINDNHPKYVITMDEYATGNHKGILHLNLREFLLKEL